MELKGGRHTNLKIVVDDVSVCVYYYYYYEKFNFVFVCFENSSYWFSRGKNNGICPSRVSRITLSSRKSKNENEVGLSIQSSLEQRETVDLV